MHCNGHQLIHPPSNSWRQSSWRQRRGTTDMNLSQLIRRSPALLSSESLWTCPCWSSSNCTGRLTADWAQLELKRGKVDLALWQDEAFHGEGHLSLALPALTLTLSSWLPSGGPLDLGRLGRIKHFTEYIFSTVEFLSIHFRISHNDCDTVSSQLIWQNILPKIEFLVTTPPAMSTTRDSCLCCIAEKTPAFEMILLCSSD